MKREDRERRNLNQRRSRAWRRRLRPPGRCAACGTDFRGKRKDAKYCSGACRQRAHRLAVSESVRGAPPQQNAVAGVSVVHGVMG
jgi:hypothetical protein